MSAPTVIMVFGAAVRPDGSPSPALCRRVEAAAAARCTQDAVFLVTGGIVVAPPAEAVLMADILAGLGIPRSRIVVEDQARTTLGSVRLCAPILARLNPERIVACSDDFHLPRCRWLLRLAGFTTEPLAAKPRVTAVWPRLREWIAVPLDTLCWALGI